MDWIKSGSFRLICPDLADVFVGREASECLQAARKVVCCEKVAGMRAQLVVVVVVESFDGRVLNRSVHPFDLAVRPCIARQANACIR